METVINPGDLVYVDFSIEGDLHPRCFWVLVNEVLYISQKVIPPDGGTPTIEQSILLMIDHPQTGVSAVSVSRVHSHAPNAMPIAYPPLYLEDAQQ